ncbi:MAG: HD-GYP domain-containing protein [Betaproteobacteria bacterium]|nr:HD-GYP domain-containing protein [Betaproteobacteria bacterium]
MPLPAIKKISVRELRPGMYVHDLDCGWMVHPFLRSRFLVSGEKQIQRIIQSGIRELYIDSARGLDAADAPTRTEVESALECDVVEAGRSAATPPRASVDEEIKRARSVLAEANRAIHTLLQDARLGRRVSVEQTEPVVEKIAESVLRNRGALLSLCAIKTKDEYTYLHSVSVCALMMVLCRAVEMDEKSVREAGLGGLLHDVGKMTTPDAILNKPGRLTDEEFALMREHVVAGREILESTPGITPVALTVAAEHHERFDGSGYPHGLKAQAISPMGQLSAIVDVYDAITSDRVYHKGIPAPAALRKLLEWSRMHFNPDSVHIFIKAVGIYPTGSLVLLESGRLAVVVDQSEGSLLEPRVRVVYDTHKASFVQTYDIDLSRGAGGAERILGYEPPGKWSIDPLSYLG